MSSDDQIETQNRSGVQTLVRVVSILPCFPSYTPRPPTPNIDKLKELLSRLKKEDPNKTDTSIIDRVDSQELCQWSQKVLQYLPSIEDTKAADEGDKNIVEHFHTIKKFYAVTKNAGFESSELDLLFNSMQIYECVMSISFVVLKDHPDTMKSITNKIKQAIGEIEGHGSNGCISLACFAAAILSNFNKILKIIDEKIGQLGIVGIAEFFINILEVFCRFFNIDSRDMQNITNIAETITQMIGGLTSSFSSIFGNSLPSTSRTSKYSPLAITERIKQKLSKFETESQIVSRTVNSFEKFYTEIQKVDDDLAKLKLINDSKREQEQKKLAPKSAAVDDDEDTRKVESGQLLARVGEKQLSAIEELNTIGRFFQHLETILSYGILLFKNEDEVLNPLLDKIDECTRILSKFVGLHPLYKILCGTNYLSTLKVIIQNIIHLLETSNLKVNNSKEFLAELSQRYPNLLYLLCESLISDGIKNKFDLPEPIANVVNDVINNGVNKFKDKFKF